jgi:hypothetical protein
LAKSAHYYKIGIAHKYYYQSDFLGFHHSQEKTTILSLSKMLYLLSCVLCQVVVALFLPPGPENADGVGIVPCHFRTC